jgi:hypothetical protein
MNRPHLPERRHFATRKPQGFGCVIQVVEGAHRDRQPPHAGSLRISLLSLLKTQSAIVSVMKNFARINTVGLVGKRATAPAAKL